MCSYLDQVGSTYYFRRAVPKDLLGCFTTKSGKPRTEWKFSLQVKDREEAKRRLRPHEIETDTLIDDARRDLRCSAPQLQEDSAAAERAREELEAKARVDAARQKRQQHPVRKQLRALWRERLHLTTAELSPEEAAIHDLLRERSEDNAKNEQAIDYLKSRIAELERHSPRSSVGEAAPQISIAELFERYTMSGAANPKTVSKWRGRVSSLIGHLGHDEARRVTRMDMNAWIASLVASGLAKKTIVDGYLPAVRAAFDVAFEDGLIPANPAVGLKVKAPKPLKLRERDLTDAEALTILKATLAPPPAKLATDHAFARRWVPWLCAYTGARVGEITQLRSMDIRQEGGIWCIHITPEAGSVKTNEARLVPLHPHLIEQGFVRFAKVGDTTPLFHRAGAGNEVNSASGIRAADIAKWVRSLGVDAPQPNHGWRHRFKTTARAAELAEHIADKIQGHAPRHEGGNYGSTPLSTLNDAISKLPRYEVTGMESSAPIGE